MKFLAVALIMLTACNLEPRADHEIAVGPMAEMKRAVTAARECGVTTVRIDPLDDQSTLLLIASDGSGSECTLKWIREMLPQTELTPAKRKEIGLS